MKNAVLVIILCTTNLLWSQDSTSFNASQFNKKRFIGISSGVGTAWSGSMIGLSLIWYKDVEKSKWHSFDDSKNWMQMDKVGHFYTAHKINQLTYDLFSWTGVGKNKSLLISSSISFGYQFTFEMLDAFSAQWGFSWSDLGANTLGTISYAAQRYFWNEERILPKYSYSPSPFAAYRPTVLGSNFSESLLKDYNGQTYWLSFSPFSFFKSKALPEWLCLSLGYSVHEKLQGSEDYYYDPISTRSFYAKREFILSLDIDFNKLPIKNPWLKAIVKQLNYLKVPFPALVIRTGNTFLHPFYF